MNTRLEHLHQENQPFPKKLNLKTSKMHTYYKKLIILAYPNNISKIKDDMQLKNFTLAAMLCFAACFSASAQTAALNPETTFTTTIAPTESTQLFSSTDDWTLFADEENKLYYIDFETLTFNVSDVIVKDAAGKEVFKDKVFDLPVDTIYELDFSKFKAGNYDIELRTFTEVVKKSVTIK